MYCVIRKKKLHNCYESKASKEDAARPAVVGAKIINYYPPQPLSQNGIKCTTLTTDDKPNPKPSPRELTTFA
jgi:hypothetical protein